MGFLDLDVNSPEAPAELEHGLFSDGTDRFSVRSTTSDPGTIRVHAPDLGADEYWVLILTGVSTSSPSADWLGKWDLFSREWKDAFVEEVFRIFHDCKSRPLCSVNPSAGVR
jgi:hypothetical protein